MFVTVITILLLIHEGQFHGIGLKVNSYRPVDLGRNTYATGTTMPPSDSEHALVFPSYDGEDAIYILIQRTRTYNWFTQVKKYSISTQRISSYIIPTMEIGSIFSAKSGGIYISTNGSLIYKFNSKVRSGSLSFVGNASHAFIPGIMSALLNEKRSSIVYLHYVPDTNYNLSISEFNLISNTTEQLTQLVLEDNKLQTLVAIADNMENLLLIGASNQPCFKLNLRPLVSKLLDFKFPLTEIVSNAAHIGKLIVFFSKEASFVILHPEREIVIVQELMSPHDKHSFQSITGVYVQREMEVYLYGCTFGLRECTMLTIQICPAITTLVSLKKSTVFGTSGRKVTLTCNISKVYKKFIIWKYRGVPEAGGIIDKERRLIHSAVRSEQEGIYTCYADTLCGVEKHEIRLIVKGSGEPQFNTAVNKTALLTCPLKNILPLNAKWFKEKSPILPSFNPRFQISETEGNLEIVDAQISDTGRYTCEYQTSNTTWQSTTVVLEVKESAQPRADPGPSQPEFDPLPRQPGGITLPAILGICFLVFCVTLLLMFCLWKYKRNVKEGLTDLEIREFRKGRASLVVPEDNYGMEEFTNGQPYDSTYELSSHAFQIERESVLGKGQFGIVYKGTLKVGDKLETVAFKSPQLTGECTGVHKKELKSLLSEVKLMIYIGNHPHIVRLIGAYTKELKQGVAYAALEFCSNGSLEKFIRTSKHVLEELGADQAFTESSRHDTDEGCTVTPSLQSTWAAQVARGMEYLQSKKIIHADLATRNILVASDLSTRITDFGLSRRLENYENYVKSGGEPLPWRWMAIESLECRNFSSASDVWSYGVTVWEIFSQGNIPYPAQTWTTDFLFQLKSGERLPQPRLARLLALLGAGAGAEAHNQELGAGAGEELTSAPGFHGSKSRSRSELKRAAHERSS